jgi:hypothetical protein
MKAALGWAESALCSPRNWSYSDPRSTDPWKSAHWAAIEAVRKQTGSGRTVTRSAAEDEASRLGPEWTRKRSFAYASHMRTMGRWAAVGGSRVLARRSYVTDCWLYAHPAGRPASCRVSVARFGPLWTVVNPSLLSDRRPAANPGPRRSWHVSTMCKRSAPPELPVGGWRRPNGRRPGPPLRRSHLPSRPRQRVP